jgi:dihydroorotase
MPVSDSALMRRALEYARMFGCPVLSHPEDLSLSGDGVMNEGRVSTRLGLKGIPGESEAVAVARDIILARLTGGRLHLCHVSTRQSLEYISNTKSRGADVTFEVTPHHFTLSDQVVGKYDTNAKMKPPLRGEEDVSAILQALKSGLVDAIASDHAPHSGEEKDQEFNRAPFGIIGLETTLGLVLQVLYHRHVISLPEAVRLLSTNPARILGLPLGSLKQGCTADVTIFDPEHEWAVDETEFSSKSRNTPFSGWKLKGKVVSVLVGGRILMRDGEVIGKRVEA